MKTKNKFIKFLASCSFVSLLMVVQCEASSSFIESDKDEQVCFKGSFAELMDIKAKEISQRYICSNKEHLLNPLTGQTYIEYHMTPDGACSIYSIGETNRRMAVARLLAYAGDASIRDLAHQDIIDAFNNDKLPSVMKEKETYRSLKASLNTAVELLREIPLREVTLRQNIISEQDRIRTNIRNYAKTEEVYRDYVNNVIANDNHYLEFQEDNGGYQATGFLDALVCISPKNYTGFRIWTQVGTNGHRIPNRPVTGRSGRIALLHQYSTGRAGNNIIDIIHRNDNHFQRLVPGLVLRDDSYGNLSEQYAAAGRQALIDERDSLERTTQLFKERLSSTLVIGGMHIENFINNTIIAGSQFSPAEKEIAQKKLDTLNAKGYKSREVSLKDIKAYCIALIQAQKKDKENIKINLNLDIARIRDEKQAYFNRLSPVMKANKGVRRKYLEALQEIDALSLKKEAAIKENIKLEASISTLEKISQGITIRISFRDVLSSLSVSLHSIRQNNENLDKLIKEKKGKNLSAEVDKLEEERNENKYFKEIFENLHRDYMQQYKKDMGARLKLDLETAKARIEETLAANPTTLGRSGGVDRLYYLREDFATVKNRLIAFSAEKIRLNQPYLNPDYLLYDPYLYTHNTDINSEYPDDIPQEAWENFAKTVKQNTLKYLLPESLRGSVGLEPRHELARIRGATFNPALVGNDPVIDNIIESYNNLQGVLNRAATTGSQPERQLNLRKRIKRIFDTLRQQAEDNPEELLKQNAVFCSLMAQNHSRCIDGLENGIENIEKELIFTGSTGTCAEYTISKILANDRHAFILDHKHFGHGIEEQTNIPELLKQRMRFAFSLRGKILI